MWSHGCFVPLTYDIHLMFDCWCVFWVAHSNVCVMRIMSCTFKCLRMCKHTDRCAQMYVYKWFLHSDRSFILYNSKSCFDAQNARRETIFDWSMSLHIRSLTAHTWCVAYKHLWKSIWFFQCQGILAFCNQSIDYRDLQKPKKCLPWHPWCSVFPGRFWLQDLLLAVQHLGYFALTPEAGNIAGDRWNTTNPLARVTVV